MSWRLLIYLTCLAIYFILFSCQSNQEGKVLKLAHGLDIAHPVHKGMVYMAERVEKHSEGKLRIQIYPNAQLGAERELLELIQIGSLAITKVSAAVMENFSPNYKVLGLPYLFRNKEHAFKVFDGPIGQSLLLEGEKFRLRGLCFYDAGSRSFYTIDRPIEEPSDLEGLKIRVMKSNTAVNMVNALGGSPTPISYGELYSALQQGVVDGAENNPPSFYSSRHYEICKYYSLDEHTAVPDVLIIGTETWKRLDEKEREWLTLAVKESVVYQREVWAQAVKESLEAVAEAGVEIIHPDKSKFAEQVTEVYNNYKDNENIMELVKKIRAVR